MPYQTIDPTTEELVANFPEASPEELERALATSAAAWVGWNGGGIGARAAALRQAADLLDDRAEELAGLAAREMGKPLGQGVAEARKCAWGCRYFSEAGPALLADEPRESAGSAAWVRHEPLGPILAIMPWNFPFWQFFRFAAPALLAGNTVLLKHAPSTPQCARAIEALLLEAGLPPGVVRALFLSNEQAAQAIGDPRVRGVTLTGSTEAGRQVASVAGRHLKPIVLELGGSDAFVVCGDADLDVAARTGVEARCQNSGQSCIAAKRFLVERRVAAPFLERF
ncbi:MAG TPA: aldehyde dehydrogenase family protein, partial [Candidatus Polarisedimenticolaceae bacterium]|nr:aldehyde dehydrogenase family protein [Candidatus Polarisedimenticolaceae bacterium]